MKKAENKLRLLIVMAMSMMLFLAACGGSSKSDTSSSMDMVAETMAASAMPESAVTAVNGLSSGTGAMISEGISGGSLEGGALEDAAEIEETVSEGMERKLIRTIDMEVQTRDLYRKLLAERCGRLYRQKISQYHRQDACRAYG